MNFRRGILVSTICLIPFFGYVVYLIGLRDYSLSIAKRFGGQVDLGGQVEFLYHVGIVEIGALGAGLTASLAGLRSGDVDRRLLKYALIGILLLVTVLMIGLSLYYRYIVSLLGL